MPDENWMRSWGAEEGSETLRISWKMMVWTQRGYQKMRDPENSIKNEGLGIKDKSTYLKTSRQYSIPGLPGLELKPFVVTSVGNPYRISPIEGSAHTSWWYSSPPTQCPMNPSSFVLSPWSLSSSVEVQSEQELPSKGFAEFVRHHLLTTDFYSSCPDSDTCFLGIQLGKIFLEPLLTVHSTALLLLAYAFGLVADVGHDENSDLLILLSLLVHSHLCKCEQKQSRHYNLGNWEELQWLCVLSLSHLYRYLQ